MNTLPLFEAMSALSTQMVSAAIDNDWDRLVELEKKMAQLRKELIRHDAGHASDATPSFDDLVRKTGLIQQMLEDDQEIRRHTAPWLASARKLLTDGVRDRAVRSAYSALSD